MGSVYQRYEKNIFKILTDTVLYQPVTTETKILNRFKILDSKFWSFPIRLLVELKYGFFEESLAPTVLFVEDSEEPRGIKKCIQEGSRMEPAVRISDGTSDD
jgi:hypothetical protein